MLREEEAVGKRQKVVAMTERDRNEKTKNK